MLIGKIHPQIKLKVKKNKLVSDKTRHSICLNIDF